MLSHIFYDLLSPRIFMSSSISAIILSTINYQQHKTLNQNQFSLMIIIWFVEWKQPNNHAQSKHTSEFNTYHKNTQQKSIVRFVVYYLVCWMKTTHKSCLYPNTQANLAHITMHTIKINCSVCCLLFSLLSKKTTFFQSFLKPNTQVNLKHTLTHESNNKTNIYAFDLLLFLAYGTISILKRQKK